MKRIALLTAFIAFLAACSHAPQSLRQDTAWDPQTLKVGDLPAETAVFNAVVSSDPEVRGRRIYDAHYLTAPDNRGGGYVAMIASFGTLQVSGPPHTWLYHVRGNRLEKLYHYPVEAEYLQGGSSPIVHGNYWAYTCLDCVTPEDGYVDKFPVRIARRGLGWRALATVPAHERPRIGREAHLVVQTAAAHYGPRNPEIQRMAKEINGFFPAQQLSEGLPVPSRNSSTQLSQDLVPRTSVNQ